MDNKEVKVESKELNELISKCLAEEMQKENISDSYIVSPKEKQITKTSETIVQKKAETKNDLAYEKKDNLPQTNFKFSWLKFTLFFIFSFGIGALLYGLYALAQKKTNN